MLGQRRAWSTRKQPSRMTWRLPYQHCQKWKPMIDIRVAATLAAVAVAAFGAEAAGTSSRHGQIISTAVPGSTDSTRLVLASEGNEARYRVRERIARLEFPSDAVGATNDLTGALVLDEYGKVVAAESKFVVDLRTLKSDRDRRDRYLQRRTIETERYPTIELVPTELPGLPFPLPESGAFSFELVGDLTLHGVTRQIGWHVRPVCLEWVCQRRFELHKPCLFQLQSPERRWDARGFSTARSRPQFCHNLS